MEIELGAVSKVVGRLLLKLTFEVRDLFLRGFFLARELGPRLEERLVFRALKELPLLGERGLVPPLGLGNELRSSLRFTGLLFLELRLCRGKFTLRGGDTLCGCFGRALLGVALGLKQISRRRRKSAQGRRRNALAGDVCGVGEEASAGRGPEGRARSGGRRGPPYAGRLAIPAGLAPARPGRLLSDGAPLGLRQLLGSRRAALEPAPPHVLLRRIGRRLIITSSASPVAIRMTWTALPITSAGRRSPFGPRGMGRG